jgi:hypothetical protein
MLWQCKCCGSGGGGGAAVVVVAVVAAVEVGAGARAGSVGVCGPVPQRVNPQRTPRLLTWTPLDRSLCRFFRAVAREGTGNPQGAAADLAAVPADQKWMVDSWNYVMAHPPQDPLRGWNRLFSGTYTFLADALAAARPDGVVAEFGVFHGKSIRLLAEMVGPQTPIDGFDTFEGIPEVGTGAGAGVNSSLSLPPTRGLPTSATNPLGLGRRGCWRLHGRGPGAGSSG